MAISSAVRGVIVDVGGWIRYGRTIERINGCFSARRPPNLTMREVRTRLEPGRPPKVTPAAMA